MLLRGGFATVAATLALTGGGFGAGDGSGTRGGGGVALLLTVGFALFAAR
jgi:hypothetical protein